MNCRKCGIELTLENKTPKLNQCKACRAKYRSEYRATHREQIRVKNKEWNAKHHEEKHAYNQAYRAANYQKLHAQEMNRARQYREANPYKDWALRVVSVHKTKRFNVELNSTELETLARKTANCNLCNVPLDWIKRTQTNPSSPTLDRTDNENTLTEATVQIVCKRCNTAKSDMTLKAFIDYCEMVAVKFGSKIEENDAF